jgi:thiamine-phosphate pyrophosphorylase
VLICFGLLIIRAFGFLVTGNSLNSKSIPALHMVHDRPIFGDGPLLAVITEPCACDSEARVEETLAAIARAVTTCHVHVVSIRLSRPPENDQVFFYQRALKLTMSLLELASEYRFKVVCSSDWIDLAVQSQAHGVHVKESHLSQIPLVREQLGDMALIGTSTHSVKSALGSYARFQPDYFFCGTCFVTASHPEKGATDLEGPTLPGQVQRALTQAATEAGSQYCPAVFAIGGIDETNCGIPVREGADGVAVIRAVLQAKDPADTTQKIHQSMARAQRMKMVDGDGVPQ